MNVRDVVLYYLMAKGYDGLFDPEESCACGVDDIMPCGAEDNVGSCQPGYKRLCTCGKGCDYHIGPDKSYHRGISKVPFRGLRDIEACTLDASCPLWQVDGWCYQEGKCNRAYDCVIVCEQCPNWSRWDGTVKILCTVLSKEEALAL